MVDTIFLVVSAGIGAFGGAYLKTKGQHLATQENFDNIRDQLRKTTLDAEEIKLTLASKGWLNQQHWNIQEQHYVNLLTHLTRFKLSLQDRNDYYDEPGSQFDETRAHSEHFQQLAKIGSDSYQAIRELIGPASIFLSSESMEALNELTHSHWGVAEYSACTADYVSKTLTLVEKAQSTIVAQAKKELTQS